MIPFTGHDKVNPKHYLDKSRLNLNANGIYIHISICPSISTCVYTYMYIYILQYCIYILHIYLIEIIQNLQICYLKFHAMNDDFQAILKLLQNSNTLILDKVRHIVIATNCHLSFTNYPVVLFYN